MKGYSQQPDYEYHETLAQVTRYGYFKMLLPLAAYNDCEVEQLDVKTAVLDGDMKEEIYMDEPDGNSNSNGRVCLLKKALHGLKQAPRS